MKRRDGHVIEPKGRQPLGVTAFPVSSLRCVQSNIVLLTQAFRKKFVIPDFQSFCAHIDDLYDNAKNLSGGQASAGGGGLLP